MIILILLLKDIIFKYLSKLYGLTTIIVTKKKEGNTEDRNDRINTINDYITNYMNSHRQEEIQVRQLQIQTQHQK